VIKTHNTLFASNTLNTRPHLLLSPSAREEFSHLPSYSLDQCDSVILGLHEPSLSYNSLNVAFRILKGEPVSYPASSSISGSTNPSQTGKTENAGRSPDQSPSSASASSSPRSVRRPTLIAPHTSAYHQSSGQSNPDPSPRTAIEPEPESESETALPPGLSLGIGPFVKALEEASGVQAEIVGKPTQTFFELALERLKSVHSLNIGDHHEAPTETGSGSKAKAISRREIAVIGDDIGNDLGGGAIDLGLTRILGESITARTDTRSTLLRNLSREH
jgi:hypothetical protein